MKKIIMFVIIILLIFILKMYFFTYQVSICNNTNKDLSINLYYKNISLSDKIKKIIAKNYLYSEGGILNFGFINKNSCSNIYQISYFDNHIILEGVIQDDLSKAGIECKNYFVDNFGRKNFNYGRYEINIIEVKLEKNECELIYNIRDLGKK